MEWRFSSVACDNLLSVSWNVQSRPSSYCGGLLVCRDLTCGETHVYQLAMPITLQTQLPPDNSNQNRFSTVHSRVLVVFSYWRSSFVLWANILVEDLVLFSGLKYSKCQSENYSYNNPTNDKKFETKLCRTYLGIMSFPTTTEKIKSRAYFAADRLRNNTKKSL